MTVTREEIMAYVDGELDEAARGRITLAALADLDLAERIAAERALRGRLQAHFAPVAAEPVPPAWVETIRAATASASAPAPAPAEVIDFAAARARKAEAAAARPRWWHSPWAGAAMAASLMLGVVVGTQWQTSGGDRPLIMKGGALVASGDLAHALDSQLASAGDGAPIHMLGTFRRAGGDVCRAFAGPQASGIACHDAGGWQVQHLLPGSAAQGAAYRQAGSPDAELMALAQDMTAGEPFDAAQEQAAKAKGWR